MSSDRDETPIPFPAPQPHDIADFVALDLGEPMSRKHVEISRGAPLLFEGGSWNFRQRDDIRDGSLMLGVEGGERHLEGRVRYNGGDLCSMVVRHGFLLHSTR